MDDNLENKVAFPEKVRKIFRILRRPVKEVIADLRAWYTKPSDVKSLVSEKESTAVSATAIILPFRDNLSDLIRTKQNITLTDLLAKEECIISDSSISPGGYRGQWYRNGIAPATTYSSLNGQDVLLGHNASKDLRDWLAHEKVHTVWRVQDEIREFSEIIKRKEEKLFSDSSTRELADFDHVRLRLSEIAKNYAAATQYAKDVVVPSDIHKSKFIYELVLKVSADTSAKKDYGHRYGREKSNRPDRKTDEQLVAMALYLSMIEKKRTAIVSSDSDIGRLLTYATHYLIDLARDEVKPYVDRLKSNPVRSYFVKDVGIVDGAFDTSQPDLDLIRPVQVSKDAQMYLDGLFDGRFN